MGLRGMWIAWAKAGWLSGVCEPSGNLCSPGLFQTQLSTIARSFPQLFPSYPHVNDLAGSAEGA